MARVIEVVSKVRVIERDGAEMKHKIDEEPLEIAVTPHWNRDELVILEVAGVKYTVSVQALNKAVENACNAHSNC